MFFVVFFSVFFFLPTSLPRVKSERIYSSEANSFRESRTHLAALHTQEKQPGHNVLPLYISDGNTAFGKEAVAFIREGAFMNINMLCSKLGWNQ